MSLEAMVKPELLAEFEQTKHSWLVPDSSPDLNIRKDSYHIFLHVIINVIIVKRKPLLLKTELIADLASVHLASKSYIVVDTSSVTKTGHKGIKITL